MALFGRKKKSETEVVEEVKTEKTTKAKTAKTEKAAKPATKVKATKKENSVTKAETSTKENETVKSNYSYRITEKATKLSDKNVYVLNVSSDTNKTELKKELYKKYKVTVLGINMVNIAKKAKFTRGRPGYRGGGKKAYVTLKAGDSIVL